MGTGVPVDILTSATDLKLIRTIINLEEQFAEIINFGESFCIG